MKPVRNLLLFCITITSLLFACKKESFTNSASALLSTSVDTLHFDTVFTSTGSVTQFVKIINNNNKAIRISSVRLAGGASSAYKMNVDGTSGPIVNNVEISANDSAYIFVTVSINPSSANLPFIVQDSIEVNYNGNRKWVQLDAFCQNAHFLRNYEVSANETWNNDKPYVILGRLSVDTNTTLTINKGCRIYMHADAPFIVHGTLQVNGDKWDSTRVVFAGDRLDVPYRDYPASYPGLIFSGVSKDNSFTYATIRNAYQGIVIIDPSSTANPKLSLRQTIIDNAYDAGILSLNSSITARNVLVSNCGKNIILAKGGTYDFQHCTVASVSNNYVQHKDPVLFVSNFLNQGGSVATSNLNATFRNCIFWGDANGLVESEVVTAKQGTSAYNVIFDQVLWRVQTQPANATVTGAINNQNPQFDTLNTSQRIYSFRLKDNSPAINKGVNTGLTIDLDGKPRPVGLPDLGAYEKQ